MRAAVSRKLLLDQRLGRGAARRRLAFTDLGLLGKIPPAFDPAALAVLLEGGAEAHCTFQSQVTDDRSIGCHPLHACRHAATALAASLVARRRSAEPIDVSQRKER